MTRFTLLTLLCCCGFVASASATEVQLFAATKSAPKKHPVVETKPAVTAFATPERAPAQQPARAAVAASRSARTTTPVRSTVSATTTFEAVTPVGAPPRARAPQPLVRSTTTTYLATTPPASSSKKQFTYTDPSGQVASAEVIRGYLPKRIELPTGKIDPKIDPKLRRAATIAQERARASTRRRCWRYVKEALLASGVIDSYPKTVYAKDAGAELVQNYGFKKLPIKDPYAAPIGSVLVYYKGRNRPGHVELRTKDGFVSDFRSKTPDRHALLGVFAKRG
ncbi:MAG TPA: hypothetical protein VK993_02290 [Chthoniobacterales bacterium]|nr:hypothetical protein [Chthoniobacterales bacterium]